MRLKLYLFRSFISVDFMKRKSNKEEQSSAYYFILKSIFLMAPNFPKDNLKVVSSDVFFKNFLIELGLSPCQIVQRSFSSQVKL